MKICRKVHLTSVYGDFSSEISWRIFCKKCKGMLFFQFLNENLSPDHLKSVCGDFSNEISRRIFGGKCEGMGMSPDNGSRVNSSAHRTIRTVVLSILCAII